MMLFRWLLTLLTVSMAMSHAGAAGDLPLESPLTYNQLKDNRDAYGKFSSSSSSSSSSSTRGLYSLRKFLQLSSFDSFYRADQTEWSKTDRSIEGRVFMVTAATLPSASPSRQIDLVLKRQTSELSESTSQPTSSKTSQPTSSTTSQPSVSHQPTITFKPTLESSSAYYSYSSSVAYTYTASSSAGGGRTSRRGKTTQPTGAPTVRASRAPIVRIPRTGAPIPSANPTNPGDT